MSSKSIELSNHLFMIVLSNFYNIPYNNIKNNYTNYSFKFLESVEDNIYNILSSTDSKVISNFLNYIVSINSSENIEKSFLVLYDMTDKMLNDAQQIILRTLHQLILKDETIITNSNIGRLNYLDNNVNQLNSYI